MKPAVPASHPILSCAEALAQESALFAGDESREWAAMQQAGRAMAGAILRDFAEIGGFPSNGRVLVLAGKGHNGGDALIAATVLREKFPAAVVEILLVFGERLLRPLTQRAWRELSAAGGRRVERVGSAYDLAIDGIFGFQFRPPAGGALIALLEEVNARPVRLRAAVDLPSAGRFQADFTYATGSVKAPPGLEPAAGRVRYLDLGFFAAEPALPAAPDRVLLPSVLAPLTRWRDPASDKRSHGHVFVVAGSREYPGAALMTVLAALRSGAGLVTAFVPESLVAAFAARAPEAIWIGGPETPDGGLALEGRQQLAAKLDRATALVIGPGLGREPETLALVADLAKVGRVPCVLDADALQPDLVALGRAPRVLTPHAGEFARIAQGADLRAFAKKAGATVVLKGSPTRVAGADGVVYHSFFGGPVLARGGSGDLLAGLIGGQLAQCPEDPLLAAARGVVWHGLAADALARAHGQVAVQTTQLLDFLAPALRAAVEGAG